MFEILGGVQRALATIGDLSKRNRDRLGGKNAAWEIVELGAKLTNSPTLEMLGDFTTKPPDRGNSNSEVFPRGRFICCGFIVSPRVATAAGNRVGKSRECPRNAIPPSLTIVLWPSSFLFIYLSVSRHTHREKERHCEIDSKIASTTLKFAIELAK